MNQEKRKLSSIKERIQKTEDRLEKLYTKLLKLLKEKCEHEETYIKEYYFSGSYLDKAHTEYITYCKICGKILNEETEEHSWFKKEDFTNENHKSA